MEAKICLIGKGNVGTSFLQLLKEKRTVLKKKFDFSFKIVAICEQDGALIDENGISLDGLLEKGKDFRELVCWKKEINVKEVISRVKINFCVETTPTNPNTGEPALSHILEALNNNIDVIAANKGPFYLQYKKIKDLAINKKCFVKYEATVASGVPILSVKESLVGNTITSIKAILNGTSNYILRG